MKIHLPKSMIYFVLAAAFVWILAILSKWLCTLHIPGIDWQQTYRPAALALLEGGNPFAAEISPDAPFFAAPWGLLPLVPLAVLPLEVGRAWLLFISLAAFTYTAVRLRASRLTLVLFLISPPVIHCLLNANIEWIPLLGFVLPPQIGLFFISVKPQTGFAVGIFWFFEAWRKGGLVGVLRVFLPVTICLIISVLFWGPWFLHFGSVLGIASGFNASLYPYTIPLGLLLLFLSIHKHRISFAMPVSPCLSPYVLFHSWSSAIAALFRQPVWMLIVVIGLWSWVFVKLFFGI